MIPRPLHVSSGLLALLAACGAEDEPPGIEPGAGPGDAVPAWFEEVAAASGIDFVHRSGHDGERYLFPEIMGGGAALFDLDSDGDLDVYLVQSGSLHPAPLDRPGNRLFANRGDGTFDDATEGSGADDRGYGMGVATGDADGDGRVDLYVTNCGPNALLGNLGGLRFRALAGAGVEDPSWSTSAAFFDPDADGDLDLFVTNYVYWSAADEMHCRNTFGSPDYCSPSAYASPAPDSFFRNRGDGTFVDASSEAGIRKAFGNGLGVVAADFDADGRIDVFVANDATENQLWHNEGDGGFRDVAFLAGCAADEHGAPKACMGVSVADVDDDGDEDLIAVNIAKQSDSFYRNEGSYFSDRTAQAGLAGVSRPFTRFGCGLADFDDDGHLDLYLANGRVEESPDTGAGDPYAEANLLFAGTASGRFEPVSPAGGTSPTLVATSRAAVFGDVDGDGGIDVLVVNRDAPVHLLRNVVPARGRWIAFRVLEEHGRDAEGATLTLSLAGRTLTRVVRSAYSYLAANDPRVHLGLGRADRVEGVRVRWVDGATEAFGPFLAGSVVELVRGAGER